jgi:hypothetical protein
MMKDVAAGWIVLCGMDFTYYRLLAGFPNQNTGVTFKMIVNHGFTRYGTAEEFYFRRTLEALVPVAALYLLGVLLLGIKWGVLHPSGSSRK